MRVRPCLLALVAGGIILGRSASAEAAPCQELAAVMLPHVTINEVVMVKAGAFVAPAGAPNVLPGIFAKLPEFCRVVLVSAPSADSHINVEVWLPAQGWNGKYQAVGDGGVAGSIPYRLMAPALAAGYVTSGTDTGHLGDNAAFMPGHPEQLIDFAYRSTHEMAVSAKTILTNYYGTAPTYSYYNACSGGGRHALTSAQRYPADFDGIVAGASSWNQPRLDAARVGVNLLVNRSAETRIPSSKYPMIHDAVLKSCDLLDGVKDGIIENPLACSFDYTTLTCTSGDSPTCLTAAQVESAKAITSPFRDPATGTTLVEEHLLPGTELRWGTMAGPEPLRNSVERVRNFYLKDPEHKFTVDGIATDLQRADAADGGLVASRNFDLRPFFSRGGKLLMWHGWGDPQVPAVNSIAFLNNVMRTVGPSASDSIALFLLPGVLHCAGGPGADTFDRMGAIEEWRERGRKPASAAASHLTATGATDRTHLLCPYPQVARWNSSGSTDDAKSFSCAAPQGSARTLGSSR